MSNFNAYSKYYDLIYNNKNYIFEVDYVISLFKKYGNSINNVLELGSGTGNHANYFTSKMENKSKDYGMSSSNNKFTGFRW
jgi:hypothetical protein